MMKVSFEDCLSVSRRPMCWTSGVEQPLARLGHVDVQALAPDRMTQPHQRGHLVQPGAGGVDDAGGADRAAAGLHGETGAVRPGDRGDRRVGADHRTRWAARSANSGAARSGLA